MVKKALRQTLSTCLNQISPEEIQRKSSAIAERLFHTSWWQQADVVFAFCSMAGEVDTQAIIQRALQEAKPVVVPRVQGHDLIFHQIRGLEYEDDFVISDWGIKEPCEFLTALEPAKLAPQTCLIVTPGLAFDREKHRLGRGGGFYDRFLAYIRRCDCLKMFAIGICFSEQVLENIPVSEHDQSVDGVITEEEHF